MQASPTRESLQQQLSDGIAALGLALPADALSRMLDYLGLLQRWNAHYNLTAVREPAAMVTRHLLDSLAVLPHVCGASLADLGAGAGLPGIPLGIAAPQRSLTLVDSNGKKARFMRAAVRELGLANAEVLESRVEAVDGSFDCIVTRAFSSVSDMLVAGGHLLASTGVWLALKGRDPQFELTALPEGFRVEAVRPLTVPGLDADRHVVIIRKGVQHA